MMDVKISRMMYFFLIINIVWDKAIGATSSVTARTVGGDAWISMSFGFIFGALLIAIMAYLGSWFREKTIIEYSEEVMGNLFSKLIGAVLAIFFIGAYAVSANILIIHATEYFMPETPVLVTYSVYTLICMYAVYLGIEVIGRFAFFGIVSIVLMNILMVMGTFDEFHYINLLPFMNRGVLTDVFGSIYIFGDVTMAILAVGFLYPMLDSGKKTVSLSFWAMLAAGILVVIWPIFETGVMGAHVMERYVVCCMEQIRAAELTKYFPRFELVMVVLFTAGCIVQSSVMYYCAKVSIKQTAGIKKDIYVNLALLILLVFATYYLGADNNYYSNFLAFPWAQISAALGIGVPAVLLVIGLLLGKISSKKVICKADKKSKT
jgi:spore germination protein (amino acid permease)